MDCPVAAKYYILSVDAVGRGPGPAAVGRYTRLSWCVSACSLFDANSISLSATTQYCADSDPSGMSVCSLSMCVLYVFCTISQQ